VVGAHRVGEGGGGGGGGRRRRWEEEEEEEEEEEGGAGGAGGDTVGRGAEGVRVSFELGENEQQPRELLELLTMSTCRRQPPRHDSRSVQIVTGHREH